MHDTTLVPQALDTTVPTNDALGVDEREVVSTHVLVEQQKVGQLRELSKRTRVAQSEYLREAVDDLLSKYHKLPEEP